MKTLPIKFSKLGFNHKQIARNDDFAIYERLKENWPSPDFEVIKITKARTEYTFPNGSVVNKGDESYPTESKWGTYGFTFRNKEAALKKYNKLTNENSI